jgi:chromosome segregation ATPase
LYVGEKPTPKYGLFGNLLPEVFQDKPVYKQGLDEAEKAQEALEDAKKAREEPDEDLEEQKGIYGDFQRQLAVAKEKAKGGDKNAAGDVLRLERQVADEKIKLNDLQSKANELKGVEIAATETLKRAQEKVYREEEKRTDEVLERIKAEEDHEKQLKYKTMKAEGKSQKDIIREQLKDEEAEYGKMLERYNEKLTEAKTNAAKGLKGEDLSESEINELEGLTKGLDAKKRGILDTAFNLGEGDKGQVTSMRRIGGGGLEYGGLQNTAKQQLDVARASLKELERIAKLDLNPLANDQAPGKMGTTMAVAADGSPASR